jgi:hypothetical protein
MWLPENAPDPALRGGFLLAPFFYERLLTLSFILRHICFLLQSRQTDKLSYNDIAYFSRTGDAQIERAATRNPSPPTYFPLFPAFPLDNFMTRV